MTTQISTVEIDGLAFNCAIDRPANVEGKPWLVFSNSLMTDLSLWDDQVAAFGDRFQILRYDQRGHGKTAVPPRDCNFDRLADDVVALMDAFSVPIATVIGVSMGGVTVMRLLGRHPKRFSGAVICDAGPATPKGGAAAWDERIAIGRAGGMAALVEPTIGRWFTPSNLDSAPAPRVRAMIAATAFDGFLSAVHALQDFDVRPDVARIAAPVLMLAGTNDGATPAAMRAMAQSVPAAEFVEIADAGHLPNIERADAFNAAIAPYLELQLAAGARSVAAPIAARYGSRTNAPTTAIPLNPVLETMLAHRSVRRFSDRKLPDGIVELLAAAAQSAPSSSNLQAMSIVAVEDKQRKARLSKLAAGQRHVADAPLLLMFIADLARLREVSKSIGHAGDGLDYTETFIVAVADASFAAQNAFVALESLGMGGCYIGAMRNHPKEVAAELGLPDGSFAVFGLTVGYPDPAVETDVKPRLGQSLVLHRERYSPPDPAAVAAYDETMRGFRSDQQMSDIAWSHQSANRVKSAESLMGRHVIRDTLQSMGLGLR